MGDKTETQSVRTEASQLPDQDLKVDFGLPATGFSEPMPQERRTEYESRIRHSLDTQAAGAERASKLFVR